MTKKIKINYSNGKSWTYKSSFTEVYYLEEGCTVDWEVNSLGIRKTVYNELGRMIADVKLDEKKLSIKDVLSVEVTCCDEDILICKNPNFDVVVDIITNTRRGKAKTYRKIVRPVSMIIERVLGTI